MEPTPKRAIYTHNFQFMNKLTRWFIDCWDARMVHSAARRDKIDNLLVARRRRDDDFKKYGGILRQNQQIDR